MSLLQSGLFDNYVSDVAVTMVVGLGYYLFNSLKKKKATWKDQNKEIKNLKSQLETALERYQYAKTIEEYNQIIKTDYQQSDDPFAILNQMMKQGIVPNIETYNALLLNTLQSGNCQSARLLKEEIMDVTGPVSPNSYTLNIFLKGIQLNYVKRLEMNPLDKQKASEVFDKELEETIQRLQERGINLDTICVNTIIDSLISQGRMEKTWEVFNQHKKIIKSDNYTYTSLLKGIKEMTLDAEWLNRAFLILEEAKIGYNLEESLFNSLLDSCFKFNRNDKAVELFNEMKEKSKNNLSEFAYLMMIKVYGKSYKLDKCMEMLKAIKSKGTPSPTTYNTLINVCLKCRKPDMAEKLLDEIQGLNDKDLVNTVHFNLINGYKNNKSFDKANRIFEKYLKTCSGQYSIDVFNSILDAAVTFNKFDRMEEIQRKIYDLAVPLDVTTFSLLLKGYSNWNQKEKVIELYNKTKSSNLQLDEIIYNSLMDLFVRLDEENFVNVVYKDMKKRGFEIGAVTYEVLLKLYYNNNNSQKAFDLFDDMTKKSIVPTENIYHMLIELQVKGNCLDKAEILLRKMVENKLNPPYSVYEIVITAYHQSRRHVQGLETVIFAMNEKVKVDNVIIDKLIDGIITSVVLQLPEKIEILSKFSLTLKELSLLISSSTYDRLSKFLFQNKTLKKLSSFSESTIYSTLPVANTVTPNYAATCGNGVDSKGSLYDSRSGNSGQYDNYAISRNPFMKKQQQGQSNQQYNMNSNYQSHQPSYKSNYYEKQSNYSQNYRSNGYNSTPSQSYNSNGNYITSGSQSLYSAPTKSLYNSNGKDDLFGTGSNFKRGNYQK